MPPPPLNASSLLDICHALEAVNITQDERSTLSVGQEDKLGTILTKLNTVLRDFVSQQSTNTITDIRNGFSAVEYGQYVGGGGEQGPVITYNNENFTGVSPRMIFIFPNDFSSVNDYYCIGMRNYQFKRGFAVLTNLRSSQILLNMECDKNQLSMSGNNAYEINVRNKSYTYLIFG